MESMAREKSPRIGRRDRPLRKYDEKALDRVGLEISSRFFLKMMGPITGRQAAMTDMQGSIDPQMMVLMVVTEFQLVS